MSSNEINNIRLRLQARELGVERPVHKDCGGQTTPDVRPYTYRRCLRCGEMLAHGALIYPVEDDTYVEDVAALLRYLDESERRAEQIRAALHAAGRMCVAQDKMHSALRDLNRPPRKMQGAPAEDAGAALTALLKARQEYDTLIMQAASERNSDG